MSSPEAAGAAPGLSVVIPVYGNERTLLRALDSIDAACQAEPSDYPVQVVVAFDGLIDSSDALVAGWVAGSPRVTVCHPRGASWNRERPQRGHRAGKP